MQNVDLKLRLVRKTCVVVCPTAKLPAEVKLDASLGLESCFALAGIWRLRSNLRAPDSVFPGEPGGIRSNLWKAAGARVAALY
jgi:hypothetical protein